VLLEDIHLFWWYNEAKASTTLKKQGLSTVVLDLVVAQGKRRLKGSNGNKKNVPIFDLFAFIVITRSGLTKEPECHQLHRNAVSRR
jgi:hypothetical protein